MKNLRGMHEAEKEGEQPEEEAEHVVVSVFLLCCRERGEEVRREAKTTEGNAFSLSDESDVRLEDLSVFDKKKIKNDVVTNTNQRLAVESSQAH